MQFKLRSDHWLLKRLDRIYPPAAKFYTTIAPYVYCPGSIDRVPQHIRRHEQIHLNQQARYGLPLFLTLYIVSPWHRWLFEREAYLENIKRYEVSIDEVVHALQWGYFIPLPKWYMVAWFKKYRDVHC